MNWVVIRFISEENDRTVTIVQVDHKVSVYLTFCIVIIRCRETF
jgi:hypothetical protein